MYNVKRFYNLLENCTYSILCDADLDDYTISLCKNTFNNDYKTIDYTYKKLNTYHAYISTNYFKFIENIKTDLLNNTKLYFPEQGKKKAIELYDILITISNQNNLGLMITLLTGTDTRIHNIENTFPTNDSLLKNDLLNNFDKYCNESDCFIYTSTVTSGVSFNDKGYYKCYAICNSFSNSYRSFVQQVFRIRNIYTNTIEIYYKTPNLQKELNRFYVPYSYDYCKNIIRTRAFLSCTRYNDFTNNVYKLIKY